MYSYILVLFNCKIVDICVEYESEIVPVLSRKSIFNLCFFFINRCEKCWFFFNYVSIFFINKDFCHFFVVEIFYDYN